MTAAGEPGYLEVCDRRSDIVSFADSDRAALDSMLTHVNAAIRHQQLLTQIRYDADHDRLTGLPNRQRLAAEIDAAAVRRPGRRRGPGLILAALGNYTEVTDTLGHAASDELLLVTAGLLREHAPPQALLARMEGEQFAVLLPGLSLAATERAARRLREAASTRARVAGLDLEVTLTIGVAAAPVHGTDAGTLMQRADVALLAAADSGGVASYHPVLDQQSLRRLQLGTELEQAMADGQISVVFQPIIDAQTSDIVSVETLVRWAHPRYGVDPARRLHPPRRADRPDRRGHRPRARPRAGPLPALAGPGHRAVGRGEPLRALPDRARPGRPRPPRPAAARRPRRAAHPGADRGQRRRRLGARQHACSPTCTRWACGCRWTTSAPATRRCPSCASCRSTRSRSTSPSCSGMSTSQGESFIARSIIELAHNLGLRVVAEGVEDELTRNLLAEMGCDKLQGFLVSRPLPDDRLESWLLARTGVRSAAPGATHRRLFVRT